MREASCAPSRARSGSPQSPTETVGDYLARWATDYAERPALIGEGESFTYRELDARANRYARWALARGLGKGDAVA